MTYHSAVGDRDGNVVDDNWVPSDASHTWTEIGRPECCTRAGLASTSTPCTVTRIVGSSGLSTLPSPRSPSAPLTHVEEYFSMTALDYPSLAGKIVLVTGGSRGIGRGIAVAFGRQGALVLVNSRTHEERERRSSRSWRMAVPPKLPSLDVGDGSAARALIADIVDRHGRLDSLVNNAAVNPMVPLDGSHGTGVGGDAACERVGTLSLRPARRPADGGPGWGLHRCHRVTGRRRRL